ncbi:MAG TPA: dihydropteroate synthase [Burkholderiaceae bacterium]|nr:dihydropteroate synthase [Burkholderiaceae bacterium]
MPALCFGTDHLMQPAMFWQCGSYTLDLSRPRVMGIVNLTPDSFSDGGLCADATRAIKHAEKLVREGADILDLGAESSRPGAEPLPLKEELARLMPVLREAVRLGVPVSVDTYKADTMREALEAGASIVNDIYALRDAGALDVVAASQCGVCLMHMQGAPKTMQQAPRYDDVVSEVLNFLAERVQACEFSGIDQTRIAVDPGFGFGKTQSHNLALLRATRRFVNTRQPVLIGVSRKSMIAHWTERTDSPPKERVAASVTAALYAATQGAQVLRVHDVRETVDALRMWTAIHTARETDGP